MLRKSRLIFLTLMLSACGTSALDPVLTFTSSATSVSVGSLVTLSWESQHARYCSATGDWSDLKDTSGSEEVTISAVGYSNFVLTCVGDTGEPAVSSIRIEGVGMINGKLVDGYIRGASIFVDENQNFIEDNDEFNSESDNEGSFEVNFSNGTIISQNGYDLDSGNFLDNFSLYHPIEQYRENIVVTPLTSLLIGFQDRNILNQSIGIDVLLDATSDDPVTLVGIDWIYDYFYEKGNQITVLAFALQNAINKLNDTSDTTLDYFRSISEELEKEYSSTNNKVDIESKVFVNNVIENLSAKKSLSITEDLKTESSEIISSILQIIQVKNDISITQSILSFGTGQFQKDIEEIFTGSISDERLDEYKNNTFQLLSRELNLTENEIIPDIFAKNDAIEIAKNEAGQVNLMVNDDYLIDVNLEISIGAPVNGSASLDGNILEYTPNNDFEGTDSIEYTITQNNKSDSATVNITVTSE